MSLAGEVVMRSNGSICTIAMFVSYSSMVMMVSPSQFSTSKRPELPPIDGAVIRSLSRLSQELSVEPFVPFGYDERQYCSPGFDLPVGSLSRSPWGRYPEYHTSADDLDFVTPERLGESLEAVLGVIGELEASRIYRNVEPFAEPQLGRRGLYSTLGGDESGREKELALLWVLHQSDGTRPLADIAARSGLGAELLQWAVESLVEAGLLAEVDG